MKKFLNYIEIQTKITSVLTFIFTILIMIRWKLEIDVFNLSIFFMAMFIFDLCTTAINNYIDAKGNGNPTGYSQRMGLCIILILLLVSAGLGMYLVTLTNLVVLVMGVLSFGIGILYTFGPVPISRQPYGEIISGVMYGYVIPFIMIYSANVGFILNYTFDQGLLDISINLMELFKFLLVFFTPTVLTSSIMLANNTCDVEKDILVKRFTLPYYLGQQTSIKLMLGIYISIFILVILAVILGYLPITCLGLLIIAPIVYKNFNAYTKDLVKRVSFPFIIKNFIIIMLCLSLLVGISLILPL